jgi:cysteinyl-tRNA synthetase
MLQSHYRSQMNFTWEAMEAARHFLLSLYNWAEWSHQADFPELTDDVLTKVKAAMENDLGSP